MNEINLLPSSQKQKRIMLSMIAYISVGFVVLLLVCGGIALTLTTVQITVNERIGQNEFYISNLHKQMKTYQNLENQVASINNTLSSVTAAINSQMHPNDILNTISNKIGPSLILTSITIGQPTSTNAPTSSQPPVGALSVTISGNITDRSQVIDFERALGADGRFSGVTYTVSNSSSMGYGQTIGSGAPTNQSGALSFQLVAMYSNVGTGS